MEKEVEVESWTCFGRQWEVGRRVEERECWGGREILWIRGVSR